MKKHLLIATASLLTLSAISTLMMPFIALAATTPSLGMASTYGILASTYTNTAPGTTINGDLGYTTGPAIAPTVTGTTYAANGTYVQAGIDQNAALAAIDAQPCTFTFAPGAINLSTDITHGPIGVYTPGVYCSTGAMDIGGPLTLNGSGTFIFRPDGAFTTTTGAVVTLAGTAACDVFWTPTQATTIATNTTFAGVVIDPAGITVGANTTWSGIALAFGGTVTTDADTITVPTCTSSLGTLHIIKEIVSDQSEDMSPSDFIVHLKKNGIHVTGSPAAGQDEPGTMYTLASGTYVVSEVPSASYEQTFGGDCDSNGSVSIAPGDEKVCTIINTDTRPSISSTGGHYIPPPIIAPVIQNTAPVNIPPIVFPVYANEVPQLPKTGVAPNNQSPLRNNILLYGAVAVFIASVIAFRRHTFMTK